MDRKIVFYSKIPTSMKEGFDIALEKEELESTTVNLKGEEKLGLLYTEDDTAYLIIMDKPIVQELKDEDEVDLNLQDEL